MAGLTFNKTEPLPQIIEKEKKEIAKKLLLIQDIPGVELSGR